MVTNASSRTHGVRSILASDRSLFRAYLLYTMQLWLVAGFIGPLVGFILGIALTYAILKRFASVRNFIFDSLVRATTWCALTTDAMRVLTVLCPDSQNPALLAPNESAPLLLNVGYMP